MKQVTTEHVQEWGTEGYAWKGQRDKVSGGGFMCVEAPEMTDREGAKETIVEERVEVMNDQVMQHVAPQPSGQKYAGGPAKQPA